MTTSPYHEGDLLRITEWGTTVIVRVERSGGDTARVLVCEAIGYAVYQPGGVFYIYGHGRGTASAQTVERLTEEQYHVAAVEARLRGIP